MFFEVNSVLIDKCVLSIFILMGSKMYVLLRFILVLRKLKELNFNEIVDILVQYVDLKLIIIVERYKFYKVGQEELEIVRQYFVKL